MKPLRARLLKSAGIIVAVLILLSSAGFALLYFEAQSYLNKNLSDFVSKKSKGKYELTFDNLQFSFRHWGIEFNEVSFHPSDSILNIINQSAPDRQFYSFASPNVRVAGIKFLELIFRKKLELGEIQISRPELVIHGQHGDSNGDKTSFISFFQELKPLVTKTFKSIRVQKIEFSDASFNFYKLLGDTKKLSNAENITIGFVNFYTDSLLLPDPARLFTADDIYLKMQNYQKKLADSLHTISAENITYSLKHAQVEIKNLKLKPSENKLSDRSKYQVVVPEILIKSSQINELYQSNVIPIDSMILSGAKISFWPGQKNPGTKHDSIAQFDLYQLIKNEISSIKIQSFRIKDSNLELFKSQTDSVSQQELKHINIKLEDFKLDSSSVQDTSRIFYAKNIDFSASDYELTLGDNVHHVRAGSLDLSTQRKNILIRNISLGPLLKGKTKPGPQNTIQADCDSIRLDQFNFKKAFHLKRFVFHRINLFNPKVQITQNESENKVAGSENPSFIYNLIAEYVKGIYSDQVLVQHGHLQLTNKTGVLQKGNIESDIRLQLNGFALDEVSARRSDRLFFADQIELNFSKYQMQLVDQLHKLTIENFELSTQKKLAQITNLHLFPVFKDNMQNMLQKFNRSELYEFTVPKLTLTNADFHQAFFNKKLAADTLNIQTPQIYYENFAFLKKDKPKAEFEDLFQLLSDYLDDIHLSKTIISDGTIRLINHSKNGKTISLDNQFSLGLENTVINKDQFGLQRLLFSEFVDFTVRDHLIRLPDQVHILKVAELGFSTKRKEVFATGIKLYPETDSKDFSSVKWNVQVIIPEIRIQGVDMVKFYFDQKIDAENVSIISPEIRLYQKQQNTKEKDLKNFTFLLPKEIESMNIHQFSLTNGSFKIFSEINNNQPYLLIQSDLKMEGRNILVQNNPALGRPEFKEGDYTSVLDQFKFNPKNKNQQFSFDELTFSTSDRTILAKQLVFKQKNKNARLNQFELRVPTLNMSGFDLDRAYQDDEYIFDSILIDKPSFQLNDNTRDSLKINPFTINLYPYFESFARIFASKSLQVNDAGITVFKNGQKKFQQSINFNLGNVRIEDKPSKGFLYADDFSFKIPDIIRKEKFYQFAIGETSYSSKNNLFSAKNIRIVPNFSKEKHQTMHGYQSDYFSGSVDSVDIAQPDIRKWFGEEKISGKYLTISGLNLNIYRDKRLPFNENLRPPMFQDMIKSFKYPIAIDSVALRNSNVTYSEQPSGEPEGKIRLSNINAKLKPFTNIKSPSGLIPEIQIIGSSTIMDSCQAKIVMKYQMNDPGNNFTADGHVSPFNMRILNPALEPLASISIRSGKVNQFNFNLSADETQASGNLYFGYDNLRISVLETKKGNTREAKFASFLANSLMLKNKNPRGKELLPDEIYFQRDPRRSIINYCWKSVFSGVRNTLGIKEKQEEKK